MPEDFNELDKKLAVLNTQFSDFMHETIGYRKNLCDKLDRISDDVKFNSNRVMELPCKEHTAISSEKFKNIDKWLGINWAVTIAVIYAIIKEWTKR